MTELEDRLVRCFASIFPTLADEEIQAADLEPLTGTDSLAGVTLVALIDQEFGVEIDLEGLLALGTFEAVYRYLREQQLSPLSLQGQMSK